MQAFQPALYQVALQRVSYDMLPGAVNQITEAVKNELSKTWGENGLTVARVSIGGVTPTEESANSVKMAQQDRLYAMNPEMKGSRANRAASEAMVGAANNANGAMTGFMGMGMMNQGGAMFGANISEQSQMNGAMAGVAVPGYNGYQPQPQAPVETEEPQETPVQEEVKLVKDEEVAPEAKEEAPTGKFCVNCGEPVSGNFCTNCGTKVE